MPPRAKYLKRINRDDIEQSAHGTSYSYFNIYAGSFNAHDVKIRLPKFPDGTIDVTQALLRSTFPLQKEKTSKATPAHRVYETLYYSACAQDRDYSSSGVLLETNSTDTGARFRGAGSKERVIAGRVQIRRALAFFVLKISKETILYSRKKWLCL